MWLGKRRIDELGIRTFLGWRHSGFSLHNAVRIGAHDSDGRRAVAQDMLRSPFALETLRHHATTGTVIYQSKMLPVLKQAKRPGRTVASQDSVDIPQRPGDDTRASRIQTIRGARSGRVHIDTDPVRAGYRGSRE
jgi:hypothetical protein